MVYRKLSRDWKHRKAMLRNMVSSLIEYESITTTHAKAKEAQVAAERLITLAKNKSPNLKEAKIRADQYVFKPNETLPKLFGELSDRYKDRTGGYTRVLRLENRVGDNAPQSILELVGGKRDMKLAITARAVARQETLGNELDEMTRINVDKIIKEGPHMKQRFDEEVALMKEMFYSDVESIKPITSTKESPRAKVRFVPNPLQSN